MRALSPRTLSELREHLIAFGAETAASGAKLTRWLAEINRALTPKRSAAPAKKLRAAKKATRKEKTANVRFLVMERAGFRCESCGVSLPLGGLELDHVFGGANRRALETPETCMALCHACHVSKTRNSPDAAYWLRAFIRHCKKHGYLHAEMLAEKRLGALEIQGRA